MKNFKFISLKFKLKANIWRYAVHRMKNMDALKFVSSDKKDRMKYSLLFHLFSGTYIKYRLKNMELCKLLILMRKSCPVFSCKYKTLYFCCEKTGHPNTEDANSLGIKGKCRHFQERGE
jgi:hypothetical protein